MVKFDNDSVESDSGTSGLPTAIDDLNEVNIFLGNLVQWGPLGLNLGLLQPTLEMIESHKRGDIGECKIAMLAAWLKQKDNVSQKGVPSWQVLRAALKKMGENALAEKIKAS